MQKKLLPNIITLIGIAAAFFIGLQIGSTDEPLYINEVDGVENQLPTDYPEVADEVSAADFNLFWEAWYELESRHIDAEETTTEEMVYSAIEGLAASYDDPYTTFFPPEEAEVFEESISGEFGGVGMEVGVKEGLITVIAPLEGTPAQQAGIEPGDVILEIDGESTASMTIDDAVELIRGEPGTEVVLTIAREGESEVLEIEITRAIIQIPTTATTLREDGVFVLSLYNFTENSAELFTESLEEFAQSGSEDLVIDLRSNPGGYLGEAIKIASHFLEEGAVVVREVTRDGEEAVLTSLGYDLLANPGAIDIAVLVNQGSASASEILAGALSEHDRAVLVGTETFGKGSVQEVVPINEETVLKITIAKWLTPEGVSISDEGLTPQIVVQDDPETADVDEALEAAVEQIQ